MNLWNFGYATMEQMYEQDYDLIDCNDGHYYIVPNAGYYYDLENGIGEYDVYDRLQNLIPLFGAKLWGKDDKTLSQENNLRVTLGDASGTNFGYETIKMKTLLLIMI